MKKSIFQGNRSRVWGLVLLAVISVLGISSCKTDYNLDKETPEWLGPSIYDYLKNNHYDTYVKLIEDLGYKDVLAKTGSKTLFVADEAAVQRFYDSGRFRKADGSAVTCYEDLSLGQKKMILYGSMLNNVYQVAMLSNSTGTTRGESMRRPSAASEFVDVPLLRTESMPNTEYFKFYRDNDKDIRILRDGSNKPLIYFTNKFLVNNKITDDDYDFLFNQGDYGKTASSQSIKHKESDASINGVNIDVQNIKCLNGFVHVVHDVIYPLPNMAEFLETSDNTKIYYSILSRFCAPYPASTYYRPTFKSGTRNWTDEGYSLVRSDIEKNYRIYLEKDNLSDLLSPSDTLFELRYFTSTLRVGPNEGNIYTPEPAGFAGKVKNVKDKVVKFDPGWSSYYFSGSSSEADLALQKNMAVMLVPSDKAMLYWWNEGQGKAIKERYAPGAPIATTVEQAITQMSAVEDFVILDLVNNNMLQSFTASVPSKFNDVLNDAQDPMELSTDDVDSVTICCNGAVYITNKVMSPTSYKSVSFPTLVNPVLRVMNWAVGKWVNGQSTGCGFFAYLNSMQSTYSFFVPVVTDPDAPNAEKGCLIYIDPVSYGQDLLYAYVFRYDEATNSVKANRYQCNAKGVVLNWNNAEACDDKQVQNRLTDMLDYHVIIGPIDNNHSYYFSKGRGTIKADLASNTVFGGYQLENKDTCHITQVYNMANGNTYVIDKPMLTSRRSVYDVVSDTLNYPEFREFFKLVDIKKNIGASDALFLNKTYSEKKIIAGKANLSTFNTYYYSVYVPDNNSILDLINRGVISNQAKISEYQKAYDVIKASGIADFELAMSKVVFDNLTTAQAIQWVTDYPKPNPVAPNAYYTQNHLDFKWSTFQTKVKTRTINFVKMHIQDKSLYVGGAIANGKYETSYINKKNIFEKITVNSNGGNLSITGTNGIVRNVSSVERLRNIMCRDYMFKNLNDDKTKIDERAKVTIQLGQIETSSFAVVHYIDGPLCSDISDLEK